jgi:hypothetical protein
VTPKQAAHIAAAMLECQPKELSEGLIAHLETLDRLMRKSCRPNGLESVDLIAEAVIQDQLGLAAVVTDINDRLMELETQIRDLREKG